MIVLGGIISIIFRLNRKGIYDPRRGQTSIFAFIEPRHYFSFVRGHPVFPRYPVGRVIILLNYVYLSLARLSVLFFIIRILTRSIWG